MLTCVSGPVGVQFHSSLASLNGLEAHLRTVSPGGPQCSKGPYSFAHFDCIQSTLTSEAPIIPLFIASGICTCALCLCVWGVVVLVGGVGGIFVFT